MERRPVLPVGASDRHRWSAGLRPASRVSAKPAPTTHQSHRCERRIATRAESRRHGAPASSPGGGLRPASPPTGQFSRWGPPTGIARVSAKPAPTTHQSHRCERRIATRAESRGHGARNPHHDPPISPLRTTHSHPRRITGTWPVLPVGASDRHRWSAGQFSRWGPPTGIARERETRTNDPTPRPPRSRDRATQPATRPLGGPLAPASA